MEHFLVHLHFRKPVSIFDRNLKKNRKLLQSSIVLQWVTPKNMWEIASPTVYTMQRIFKLLTRQIMTGCWSIDYCCRPDIDCGLYLSQILSRERKFKTEGRVDDSRPFVPSLYPMVLDSSLKKKKAQYLPKKERGYTCIRSHGLCWTGGLAWCDESIETSSFVFNKKGQRDTWFDVIGCLITSVDTKHCRLLIETKILLPFYFGNSPTGDLLIFHEFLCDVIQENNMSSKSL